MSRCRTYRRVAIADINNWSALSISQIQGDFPGGAGFPLSSARLIFSAIEKANDRGGAFRSDLRSCPIPTLVPGSPTEPQGSWPFPRGRAVAQPDPDSLVPIESPETIPYNPGIT